jgi:hypothetical protein
VHKVGFFLKVQNTEKAWLLKVSFKTVQILHTFIQGKPINKKAQSIPGKLWGYLSTACSHDAS